ncbi:MAG: transglycosylase domain-containing protein [Muribaculaceae bacterium]|uniref:transglycosylase domain-containing protein n=1 Tax=Candidatus Limisoma sp. TaxID=3076476 RepID=UPI000EE862DE|nr:transglycosylase domain-containing protein [Muribaculaceae bacterium]MBP6098072.1 transglycosylase domain-containing protein [Muribaculaceae bacterium]MEE0625200.1 transglycosylase domain-containing protein [Muribaculaceae bacterium]HAM94909.1 penicillin-binding protein [Porphyromonadaceae bacterium]
MIRALWTINFCGVALVMLIGVMIYHGYIGYMPPVEGLLNPEDRFASRLFTSDGVEMGRFYQSRNNRVYADYSEISPNVINALIATEDERFMQHSGIDIMALSRVLFKTILLRQKNAGGGSTITQQLAKQLYSPESDGLMDRFIQKPVEWAIAVKLERYYTKEEIIKMYLNQFDFLNNAVGIKTAAHVYFNTTPDSLKIEQAAMLVGMAKNPSLYNPVRADRKDAAVGRRNVVLQQMLKADLITEAECDSLCALPLDVKFTKVDHKDGIAPYFREAVRLMMQAKEPRRGDYPDWDQQRFVDDSIQWATNPLYGWVEKNPKPDGTKYNIYTDGLRIYTSIDSRMQKYAEEAVIDHLKNTLQPQFDREKGSRGPYTTNSAELGQLTPRKLIDRAIRQSERYRVLKNAGMSDAEIMEEFDKPVDMTVFSYDGGQVQKTMSPRDSVVYQKMFLRAGFMSMDPLTGQVKAYVGGPNFHFFQYDMAGVGRRQIGSTVKPFLYTYAFEEGFTPCDMFLNAQPSITLPTGEVWAPRNTGHARIGEMVDLYWALTNSNNWISARLMSELSPSTLARTMHTFGITNHLDPVVSLCLGPCDVSVREMVTAYTAFSNKGLRVDPIYVTKITDNNGNVISEFTPQYTEVMSQEAYFKMVNILQNVINSGTGSRLRRAPYNITAVMGGKTGTTNYNADGWFMGFTPNLVSGVWVGGDERYIHFNRMAQGQGAAMALPIYGLYMKKVYADKSLPYSQTLQFPEPPAGFSPCYKESYGDAPAAETPVEAIDNAFE